MASSMRPSVREVRNSFKKSPTLSKLYAPLSAPASSSEKYSDASIPASAQRPAYSERLSPSSSV